MKISGQFVTPTAADALRKLGEDDHKLSTVSGLQDVHTTGDGVIHAMYAPAALFVPSPFRVAIRTDRLDDNRAALRVHARLGPNAVDVQLTITFANTRKRPGTAVHWSADVAVRGPAASVGQRVTRDLATKALDEVLQATAAIA